MFKRLSAWHILTAGLIGLVPACGSGDKPPKKETQIVETHQAREMPGKPVRESELTPVKPTEAEKVIEPEAEKPVVKSSEEILDALTLAAERNPDDVKLRVKLARALYDGGKLKEARSHAEAAIENDPESGAAYYVLGRIEMAAQDMDAAMDAFSKCVEKDEDNSYAWNNLGYIHIEKEQWEDAAAALENATSGAKPTDYMWNNLGMAYEHLDRIREARAAYRQAVDLGSSKGQANLERLEGVTSLVVTPKADPNEDPHDDTMPIE
ncbi:MAG TPA: tetratricopeptide repeat protein [Thermoanaerobaculia bacterium]|nr:tetratricopeptide repeat protein [Thermoanaerobaculia bacterium]